VFRLVR